MKSFVYAAALASLARSVLALTTVIEDNDFNSNNAGWTYRDDTHFVSSLHYHLGRIALQE